MNISVAVSQTIELLILQVYMCTLRTDILHFKTPPRIPFEAFFLFFSSFSSNCYFIDYVKQNRWITHFFWQKVPQFTFEIERW